jgi:predicted DNA-binding protein YlxM (UPF0122 family)
MAEQPTTIDGAKSDEADVQDASLDRVVRIGILMDLYGGLLTERQRRYVQMHFNEDLSFGEIARTHNVSRQAIHDAVKHAEKALESYESKLGLMARGITRNTVPEIGKPVTASTAKAHAPEALVRETRSAVGRLRAMAEKLRLSGGIIYNAEGYLHEVNAIAQDLEDALKD